MNSDIGSPSRGDVVFGEKGEGYPVAAVLNGYCQVLFPDGKLRKIKRQAVKYWLQPHQTEPATYPIGAIVHKLNNHGWTGIIHQVIDDERVEIQWWPDNFTVIIPVKEIRPADESTSKGYKRAFSKDLPLSSSKRK
jgi:hypothetical protein